MQVKGAQTVLPPGTSDAGEIRSFPGAGDRDLRYRVVSAARPRHHVLYLHGIESHGGWFLPAAQRLRDAGCTTYLLDRRGSGLNRDPDPGDARSSGELLEDVELFRRHVDLSEVHLVGLSWGAKLAVATALRRPTGVASIVLITPGLRALVDLSPLQKVTCLLSLLTGGGARLALPIKPDMFTTTTRFLDFITQDPWRLHRVTARFLLASRRLDRLIDRRIAELRPPVLLLQAARDRIIDNAGVVKLLGAAGSGAPRLHVFDEATHALQFDQVDELASRIMAFLDEPATC